MTIIEIKAYLQKNPDKAVIIKDMDLGDYTKITWDSRRKATWRTYWGDINEVVRWNLQKHLSWISVRTDGEYRILSDAEVTIALL